MLCCAVLCCVVLCCAVLCCCVEVLYDLGSQSFIISKTVYGHLADRPVLQVYISGIGVVSNTFVIESHL